MGVATCDKGLPAMMLALAAQGDLPVIIVPGGVTLPPTRRRGRRRRADDRRPLRPRQAHGAARPPSSAARLRDARRRLPVPRDRRDQPGGRRGARARAPPLGARAVGPAGLARAGAPLGARPAGSGGARAVAARDILTDDALHNAMVVHAAFGGSTNLLLHMPAIAYAAGLPATDRRRLGARQPRRAAPRQTCCRTARSTTRPCACSWPAACPR